MIEYEKYRKNFFWIIFETKECINHIDEKYKDNNDIYEIIDGTINRFQLISDILHFNINNTKKSEKRLKFNYWFFNPEIITLSGITPDKSFHGTGSVSSSGLDYVVYNDSWKNHIEHIFHEEVHLITKYEIGEAPSLLNEGLAVYTELKVYKKEDYYINKYFDTWKNNISNQKGILTKLMSNEYFWSNFGKMPLYTIGAAFIHFLTERYGIELVKSIFENTHFFDETLSSVIENKTNTTIENLEMEINEFYK